MPNVRYGRWTVLKQAANSRKWTCRCNCGVIRDVAKYSLTSGASLSCGCYNMEVSTAKGRGQKYTQFGPRTKLYRLWSDIKTRTVDVTNPVYGGRGIRMLTTWRTDYLTFVDYVLGLPGCPSKRILNSIGGPKLTLSIDRVNNDKGYMPGNIRWATATQQVRNRRVTIYVSKRVTLAEACASKGLHYGTVYARIVRYGWPIKAALNTPSKRHA